MAIRYIMAAVVSLFFMGVAPSQKTQLDSNVYRYKESDGGNTKVYRLMVDGDYAIMAIYKTSPPEFVKSFGGFYSLENDSLMMDLEFNSDFKNDSLKQMAIPCSLTSEGPVLSWEGEKTFKSMPKKEQDLDGEWLFAARIGEEDRGRRDDTNPRKTLKLLLDGYFQWVAYNTDTFDFFGTGGGTYTADGGRYIENIDFFSRDNGRVGQTLGFDYEVRGKDWYHTGKSSKGDPLGEVWSKR